MNRSTSATKATARSMWLSELADAVERAQRLSWTLGIEGGDVEAQELYARLEWVRVEIESLRLSGWTELHEELAPDWINDLLAQGRLLKSPASD